MGLSRRGRDRFEANIWPGFVDAMTALLMVLIFALTIFMVLQSVMRDTISTQDNQLDALSGRVAELSDALSVSDQRASGLARDLESEQQLLRRAEDDIASARSEIDAQTEAARLSAARREALEALIADLRRRGGESDQALAEAGAKLDAAEVQKLADAAAAAALRERLAGADAELTAMNLRLEGERKKAEDTLTLLAAAEAAKTNLDSQLATQATEAQRQAAILALAQQQLGQQEASSADEQRRVALLNQQVAELNRQLASLQDVLNVTSEGQQAADLKVEDLGRQLNAALIRAAGEERKRLELEEDARHKAEAEVQDLARYRSEFFGRLSQILAGRDGVTVVGDRFVFSSEVLFQPGEAALSDQGRQQIAGVADMLHQIANEIPPEIDWIIRVDGHTDNQPLSGQGRFRDNWELSQARALAVVRYMIDDLNFPRNRLAASGFADTRPVNSADTAEARAQNRRIELKLTER